MLEWPKGFFMIAKRLLTASIPQCSFYSRIAFCHQRWILQKSSKHEDQNERRVFKNEMLFNEGSNLEKHFQQISQRHNAIGDVDDPNLKQAFLSLILEILGNETYRILKVQNLQLQSTPFGELWQYVTRTLKKNSWMTTSNKEVNSKKLLSLIRPLHQMLFTR